MTTESQPAGAQRKLYTVSDVALRLGLSRQYIGQFVHDMRHGFPAPYDTLSGNLRVWRIEDVEAWIEKRGAK